MLSRSCDAGVDSIIITAGCIQESIDAINLISDISKSNINPKVKLFTTAGIHPTNAKLGLDPNIYSELKELASHESVVAFGELGLDYDRLDFCSMEIQKLTLKNQLEILKSIKKPMFLHCRNSARDLISILEEYKDFWMESGGVVHSFDGTIQEAQEFISMGLYIGINGCSLKTQENLKVVSQLPMNRIMIESDAPWCGIKRTHASFEFIAQEESQVYKKDKFIRGSKVKDRNEPSSCRDILYIMSRITHIPVDELAVRIYENSKLFLDLKNPI